MIDDLISRRAAIETLLKGKIDEDKSLVECPAECNSMIDGAIEDIKALPTADVVERKKGKWVVIMNEPMITFDECKCSECGVVEYFNKGWKKFSFCPNCGAEME